MNILNCALSDFTRLTPHDSNATPNWTNIYIGDRCGTVKTIAGDYLDYYFKNGECIIREAE